MGPSRRWTSVVLFSHQRLEGGANGGPSSAASLAHGHRRQRCGVCGNAGTLFGLPFPRDGIDPPFGTPSLGPPPRNETFLGPIRGRGEGRGRGGKVSKSYHSKGKRFARRPGYNLEVFPTNRVPGCLESIPVWSSEMTNRGDYIGGWGPLTKAPPPVTLLRLP